MGKLTMTRRAFAKLSAATAAVATVGAASYGTALAENKVAQVEASEIKRIRSCCRGWLHPFCFWRIDGLLFNISVLK